MRGILTLIVIGIGFCTQPSLAVMPYLSDGLTVNPKLSKKKQATDLAVKIVLWAEKAKPFVVEGKQCDVAFAMESCEEDIKRMLSHATGLQHVRRALTPRFMAKSKYDRTYQSFVNGELVLRRLGCCYTLCDKRNNRVHFFVGDQQQVHQCKNDYQNFLNWRSEIVTENMESVYIRYLIDGTITPSFILFIFSEFHGYKDAGLGDLFKAYMQRGNVDAEIVMDAVHQALNYECGRSKLQVFIAYMRYAGANSEVIEEIYKQTAMFNDSCAAEIYKAYMLREDVTPQMMGDILCQAEGVESPRDKVFVVRAYIGNEKADPDKVRKFMEESQLKTHQNAWEDHSLERMWMIEIHTAYLGRGDADLEIVSDILKKAKEFGSEYYKAKVYAAYVKGVNLDHRVIESLIIQGLLFCAPQNIIEFSQACAEQNSLDHRFIAQFLDILYKFQNPNLDNAKADVFCAYIARPDAQPEVAAEMLQNITDAWSGKARVKVYSAYIRSEIADPKIVNILLERIKRYRNADEILEQLAAEKSCKHRKSARK